MTPIQFGERVSGRTYEDRRAAFGVLVRDGMLAVAAIDVYPGEPRCLDLPGGGIDPGETELQALIREFGEEVGLKVTAGDLLVRASQLHINPKGRAVNNHGVFFAVEMAAEDSSLKIEDDHDLVWMAPADFVRSARHEAQAWAVCVWLRNKR